MEDRKKELEKRESLELGIPVVYRKNGDREVSGEVVFNREVYRKDGLVYAPKTIIGISLYRNKNYSGSGYRFIVPDNWLDVRRFTEISKDYKKEHSSKKALDAHITKIKQRGGRYFVKGMTVIYFFP